MADGKITDLAELTQANVAASDYTIVYDSSTSATKKILATVFRLATTTVKGLVEKSTSAENIAGTSDTVTPTVAGVKEMIETHGSWVLLSMYDFAVDGAVSTIEFKSDTYRISGAPDLGDCVSLKLRAAGIDFASTGLLELHFSTDDGSTYVNSAGNYGKGYMLTSSDSYATDDHIEIYNQGSTNQGLFWGEIDDFNVARRTQYRGTSAAVPNYFRTYIGERLADEAHNALRLVSNAGNTSAGRVFLYGLVKP